MSENFAPKNRIQKLAYNIYGIDRCLNFEKELKKDPWNVSRTTARYWWENGVTTGMKLIYLKIISGFFGVTIDELTRDM